MVRILLALFITTIPSFLWATDYYVDPDFGGSSTGASATPWTSLDSSAWATINTELASGPVTVFFSAREASSDTSEQTTTALSIKRTDTSTNRLVLDGKSKYNTSDSTPDWDDYDPGSNLGFVRDGGNAFEITTSNSNILSSEITSAKQNHVTLRGFRAINTGGGKCVTYWAGDNVIVHDIYCTQTATATGGPSFYFQCILNDGDTTCPGDRDGGASCFPSDNIEWGYLNVDGGYGEGLYHCGCYNQTDAECQAGHSNVSVHHSIFKDSDLRGGQGDAIEIKPDVGGLHIYDNIIYFADRVPTDGDVVAGIIFNASAVVERNLIYNYAGDGIQGREDNTNANDGFRDATQTKIINNVIIDVGQHTGTWVHGIHFDYDGTGTDHFDNVLIANNTIYKAGDSGIYVAAPSATTGFTAKNNIVSLADGIELYSAGTAIKNHDYNLLYDTSGNIYNVNGTTVAYNADITAQEANSLTTEPDFVSISSPYSASNFSLVEGSAGIDAGTSLSTDFTDDYDGETRSGIWDVGAYEYQSGNQIMCSGTWNQ